MFKQIEITYKELEILLVSLGYTEFRDAEFKNAEFNKFYIEQFSQSIIVFQKNDLNTNVYENILGGILKNITETGVADIETIEDIIKAIQKNAEDGIPVSKREYKGREIRKKALAEK